MRDFSREVKVSTSLYDELVARDLWASVDAGDSVIIERIIFRDQDYDTIVRDSQTGEMLRYKAMPKEKAKETPMHSMRFFALVSKRKWHEMCYSNIYMGDKNEAD